MAIKMLCDICGEEVDYPQRTLFVVRIYSYTDKIEDVAEGVVDRECLNEDICIECQCKILAFIEEEKKAAVKT